MSFALSKDDPFVCIDLDRVDDSFGDFLNDFHDTYREVSQSGRGVHIEGAIAEAVYLYENKLHDFYLPKELKDDLNLVIQTHKSENRHVQNFLDFMEWKTTKSDTPDLLCSAEFTSKYPETNEKVFSELMANEMAGEWILEANVKSKKVRIDGVVRVSKKFYKRTIATDFVEVEASEIPF